jgi:hypothetical protein
MFHATIKGGSIEFGSPPAALAFQEWKRAHEGERVVVELDKPTRSTSQNAYYWAYLEIIARETGDNAEDLHEFLKRKLLPPRFTKVRGEEIKLPASTTKLDKAAMTDYLEKIAALTGVPLPDPEAAGYISNYQSSVKQHGTDISA